MIAVDEQGTPIEIAPLKLDSAIKKCRYDAALMRRKLRLAHA